MIPELPSKRINNLTFSSRKISSSSFLLVKKKKHHEIFLPDQSQRIGNTGVCERGIYSKFVPFPLFCYHESLKFFHSRGDLIFVLEMAAGFVTEVDDDPCDS